MEEVIIHIFGYDNELSPTQSLARAILIFFIAIVLIRISGRRSFGLRSPFDNVVPIMLGAVLSRSITGASPFWDTVAASAALALLHRLIAILCVKNRRIENVVKGKKIQLIKEGIILEGALTRSLVSHTDLKEQLRRQTVIHTLDEIETAYLERNGEITFIPKEKKEEI